MKRRLIKMVTVIVVSLLLAVLSRFFGFENMVFVAFASILAELWALNNNK